MRSSHCYQTMSDFHSPYMGWAVPYSWQEPEEYDNPDDDDLLGDNFITYDMIPEDNSDYDDEGEFTLR